MLSYQAQHLCRLPPTEVHIFYLETAEENLKSFRGTLKVDLEIATMKVDLENGSVDDDTLQKSTYSMIIQLAEKRPTKGPDEKSTIQVIVTQHLNIIKVNNELFLEL